MKLWPRLRAVLREPLAQFMLVGIALVCLERTVASGSRPSRGDGGGPEQRRIIVDRAFVKGMSSTYERSAGRPMTPPERRRMLDDAIDEEILYREAKAMHLDEDDAIVRRRLVQKAEFLIDDAKPIAEPTSGELEQYLAAHADGYRSPLTLTLRHIFFSRDRRGLDAERDAQKALALLRRDPAAKVDADAFLSGETFRDRAERDIDGIFGSGTGAKVAMLPVGEWSAPIASVYGVHLIRVEARREPEVAPLAEVRAQVRRALIDERREQNRRAARAALRAEYVVVDRGGWDTEAAVHAMNDLAR